MELYYAFSVIIVLAAVFSYVNVRYVKLPMTIGIMVIAMMEVIFLQDLPIDWNHYYRALILPKY